MYAQKQQKNRFHLFTYQTQIKIKLTINRTMRTANMNHIMMAYVCNAFESYTQLDKMLNRVRYH